MTTRGAPPAAPQRTAHNNYYVIKSVGYSFVHIEASVKSRQRFTAKCHDTKRSATETVGWS
jgi:hypothetical protein